MGRGWIWEILVNLLILVNELMPGIQITTSGPPPIMIILITSQVPQPSCCWQLGNLTTSLPAFERPGPSEQVIHPCKPTRSPPPFCSSRLRYVQLLLLLLWFIIFFFFKSTEYNFVCDVFICLCFSVRKSWSKNWKNDWREVDEGDSDRLSYQIWQNETNTAKTLPEYPIFKVWHEIDA